MADITSILSTSDPSLKYLSMIWGNVLFPGGGSPIVVMSAVTSAITTVVLAVASCFFTWQLIAGTVQSAHHGEVLGRNWSSLWVPIRFVVAGAMMIPIGSDGSIGLQMLVASIVKMALSAGDFVAGKALAALMVGAPIAAPPSQPVDAMADQAWKLVVCEQAWNAYALTGAQAQNASQATVGPLSTPPSGILVQYGMIPQSGLGSVQTGDCPIISIPSAQYYQTFAQAKKTAVNSLISGLEPIAKSLAAAARPNPDADTDLVPPGAAQITRVVNAVQVRYDSDVQAAVTTAAGQIQTQLQTQTSGGIAPGGSDSSNTNSGIDYSSLAKCGFVCLGSYYNQMARMNSDAVTDVSIAPTSTVGAIGADMSVRLRSSARDTRVFYAVARDLWAASKDPARQGWTPATPVYGTYMQAGGGPSAPGAGKNESGTPDGDGVWGAISRVISGAVAGLMSFFSGAAFNPQASSTNPLGSLASIGAWMSNLGLGVEEALSMAAGKEGASSFLNSGAGALLQDGTHALVLGGIFLSEVLPLMPYLLWLLSCVAYFTLVTEALIAAPIWGFAHLKTGGEGIHGEASSGYMILFNIMFRPALMVAGLIAGMGIFSVAAEILNNTFSTAVLAAYSGTATASTAASVGVGTAIAAAGGAAGGILGGGWVGAAAGLAVSVLVKLVITIAVKFIIFTGTLFVVAERSFSLIHSLPDAIMRWVGGAESGGSASEDADKIRGAVSTATGQISSPIKAATGKRIANRVDSDKPAVKPVPGLIKKE